MATDLVTVGPETTLREVAEVLSGRGIGGVPVVAGERLVGVVSASDIMDFDASDSGVPVVRAAEPSLADLDLDPEWDEGEPTEGGDDGVARFFVDLWEDAGADVLERFRQSGGPEWDVLEEHTAAEVMTRRVSAMPPDTSVGDAARRMVAEGIHRLLVVEDEGLVGLVTTMDFLRLIAQGRI